MPVFVDCGAGLNARLTGVLPCEGYDDHVRDIALSFGIGLVIDPTVMPDHGT